MLLWGCGGEDGGLAPTPPTGPVEAWSIASEASFDIRCLTEDPEGNLIAVGGGRILTRTDAGWNDSRLEDVTGLNGVWAAGGVAYAVGDHGLVLRRDSGSWSTVPTGLSTDLRSVAGRGPSDVFIVGEEGTILHFDGLNWVDQSVVAGEGLLQVWCHTTGPSLAVSSQGNVWRESAGVWNKVDLGIEGYEPEELVGISGTSAENLFAFGDHERVLAFDGLAWRIDRDGPSAHVIVDLTFGPTGTPIAAIDDGRILTRDGGTWQVAASLGFPTFPSSLHTGAAGHVYLAGSEAGVLQLGSEISDWAIIHRLWRDDIVAAVPDGSGGRLLLAESGLIRRLEAGRWLGSRPQPATVVARAWSADGSSITTIGVPDQIAVYDGAGFTSHALGLGLTPRGIDGRADGTLLIVGRDGRIASGSESNWQEQVSGSDRNLWDVRFLAANEAVAVGEGGTVLHWDGATWQPEAAGTEADLLQLARGRDGVIYALGRITSGITEYLVFRRDAGGWSSVGSFGDYAGEVINSIALDAAGDLRACSAQGGVFIHRDGRWYRTESRPEYRLLVVADGGDGSVLAAGGDGVILTYR